VEERLKKSIHLEVLDLSTSLLKLNFQKDDYEFKIFSNYEESKNIFRASLRKYKESEKTYTLEDHATENIELYKDLVGLYSHCLLVESGNELLLTKFLIF
jgi:hypothetical protein